MVKTMRREEMRDSNQKASPREHYQAYFAGYYNNLISIFRDGNMGPFQMTWEKVCENCMNYKQNLIGMIDLLHSMEELTADEASAEYQRILKYYQPELVRNYGLDALKYSETFFGFGQAPAEKEAKEAYDKLNTYCKAQESCEDCCFSQQGSSGIQCVLGINGKTVN